MGGLEVALGRVDESDKGRFVLVSDDECVLELVDPLR